MKSEENHRKCFRIIVDVTWGEKFPIRLIATSSIMASILREKEGLEYLENFENHEVNDVNEVKLF